MKQTDSFSLGSMASPIHDIGGKKGWEIIAGTERG
jgi:hypothetical protein